VSQARDHDRTFNDAIGSRRVVEEGPGQSGLIDLGGVARDVDLDWSSHTYHYAQPARRGLVSRGRAIKEVAVLVHRAGKDVEVNLTVVVDRQHANDGDRLGIPGKEHGTDLDGLGVASPRQGRPPIPIIVLRVEVSPEI
jgi:hypothetical protein